MENRKGKRLVENRYGTENRGNGIDTEAITRMVTELLQQKLKEADGQGSCGKWAQGGRSAFDDTRAQADGVTAVKVPRVKTGPADRLDTGSSRDQVYTHDLFTLAESPRLGCGIMEMAATTFDWTLNYDEIDYVIEGSLTILKNGKSVTAGPGEIILIPKGSSIQFSVPGKARFLYVTYPADWNGQ